jgi:CIC family chloride channel protein
MKISSWPYFEKWIFLGFIIGILIGIFAISFTLLLNFLETIFLKDILQTVIPKPLGEGGSLSYTFISKRFLFFPIIVGLGGLISGILVYKISPETAGGGIDFAIESYHKLQGKMRKRIPIIELLSSTFILGTGGSAGDLGPMGLIGGGLGSAISQYLGLTPEDSRKAVAVGIGAGVGAIFKAPIGGALLSAEILYRRDLEPDVILPSMIASATGYSIYGSVVGFEPLFGVYPFHFSPLRLPLYALLGIIIGLLSILFVKIFKTISVFFKKIQLKSIFKPAIGGLTTGMIILIFPEVIGTGYGWDDILEFQNFSAIKTYGIPLVIFLFILAIAKMFSSSLTIGSGGSGGIEAPAFEIGAFIGAGVGLIFHNIFPSLVPYVAPFVVIGMLTMFGAPAKAPISVMIIITEMTSSLQLLPGEMIAVALAYVISGKYTLYPAQYPTRKDSPAHKSEYEIPVMLSVKVNECPLTELKTYSTDDIEEVRNRMEKEGYLSLPVVDKNNTFIGIVYYKDIVNKKGEVINYTIRGVPYVSLNANLEDAWEVISRTKTRWVAVVENGKLVGVVTTESLLDRYEKEVIKIKGKENTIN